VAAVTGSKTASGTAVRPCLETASAAGSLIALAAGSKMTGRKRRGRCRGTVSAVGSTENRTPAIAGVLKRRDTMKKASRSDESERCDVRNGGGNPRRSHLLYRRSQLHRPGQAPEPILHELI
jgi:hypothetical protein